MGTKLTEILAVEHCMATHSHLLRAKFSPLTALPTPPPKPLPTGHSDPSNDRINNPHNTHLVYNTLSSSRATDHRTDVYQICLVLTLHALHLDSSHSSSTHHNRRHRAWRQEPGVESSDRILVYEQYSCTRICITWYECVAPCTLCASGCSLSCIHLRG